jgi:hypothetical protein
MGHPHGSDLFGNQNKLRGSQAQNRSERNHGEQANLDKAPNVYLSLGYINPLDDRSEYWRAKGKKENRVAH